MDNNDRVLITFLFFLSMVHGCSLNLIQTFTLDKAVKEIKTSIEEVKNSNHTKE